MTFESDKETNFYSKGKKTKLEELAEKQKQQQIKYDKVLLLTYQLKSLLSKN